MYKPPPSNKRQIRKATGQLVPYVGIGNVGISIWISGRGRGLVHLSNVLYVPEAKAANLISMIQMSANVIATNIRI